MAHRIRHKCFLQGILLVMFLLLSKAEAKHITQYEFCPSDCRVKCEAGTKDAMMFSALWAEVAECAFHDDKSDGADGMPGHDMLHGDISEWGSASVIGIATLLNDEAFCVYPHDERDRLYDNFILPFR